MDNKDLLVTCLNNRDSVHLQSSFYQKSIDLVRLHILTRIQTHILQTCVLSKLVHSYHRSMQVKRDSSLHLKMYKITEILEEKLQDLLKDKYVKHSTKSRITS